MFSAVTGRSVGQKLKKTRMLRYRHAKVLMAIPNRPGMCQGPHLGIWLSAGSPRRLVDLVVKMPPVQRRYRSKLIATRYEDCRPDTDSETRSLNAVDEPRMMRERSMEIPVVTIMDLIGRDVRGFTYTTDTVSITRESGGKLLLHSKRVSYML